MSSSASSNNTDEMIEQQISTSSSSIPKSFKYDVFISFRGEDTRKNFVDHLYQALKYKGIYTYKDDEKIQKGERISDDLIKAIEDSKFYIIVFSKNYASSSWCLEELVKIMECHKMPGHTAYPVFYDVEPTEVRNQIGAVGDAFSKHENQEAAGKWKGALKEAASLPGRVFMNTLDAHEAEFIRKIVGEISLELRSISFGFDEKLVGMETRVKDVVDSLEMGIDDDVWMIGIKGMGGAGKTTTARAVFDRLSADFEAKSFVANVREVSEPSMSGLKKLQEQVLSDVMKEEVTLDSVYDGINMMKRRMRGIKVLLVLDDVNHIDQLVALAGQTNWFKKGSRIIVTTRDEQVLQAHRVNFQDIDKVDHRVKIRDIDLLSDEEAIFLLSRHAFGRAIPPQEFEELSRKVVQYAAGLPLTVKVLGSFLCEKDKDEWVDAIERLKKIPLEETLKEAADLAGGELKNTLDLDGGQDEFIKVIVDKMSLELNFGFDANSVGMVTQVKDVVTPATYFFQFIAMLSPMLNKLVEVEVDLTPGSAFSFIITCLLAFAGLKSQSVAGFPFKTHPNAIKVPVTSLLIYAFASMAEHVVSVARLDHTSVYAIIARLGHISSLCLFVTSLAILIYI